MTKTYNILVDIDALLDTRLTIAIDANEKAAAATLSPDALHSWWTRPHDHFDHPSSDIRIDDYKALWDARDATVLPKSLMTNMLFYLREHTLEILDGQFGRSGLDIVEYVRSHVDINTYPYTLDPVDEQRLSDVVRADLAMGSTVRCVHIPHSKLSPAYLSEAYQDYILYDFSSWVHNFERELVRSKLPGSCTMLVPSLLHDNTLDTIEDLDDDATAIGYDKQMALKVALSMFIQYEPLPTMLFSVFHQGFMENFRTEMLSIRKELRDRREADYA